MKFVWEDGYEREISFGKKIVGLTHNSVRPSKLILSDEEKELAKNNTRLYMIYLKTVLK